jgi:hypothetical protein
MGKIEMDFDTKLPPDKVLAALTDFSDRRPDIWPVLSREYYEVYSLGETSADVREGQTKPVRVWAKEHYDWSTPGTVVSTVEESGFTKPGSSVAVTVKPGEGGGSHLHVTWERFPASMAGRIVVGLMMLARGKPMISYWKKTLDGLAEKS